jgi:hypothetical protein
MILAAVTHCATVKYCWTVQTAGNAQCRRTLTMCDCEVNVDAILPFDELAVLANTGKLRPDVAVKLALERHESVDAARRHTVQPVAYAEDVAALDRAERRLEGKGRGKRK